MSLISSYEAPVQSIVNSKNAKLVIRNMQGASVTSGGNTDNVVFPAFLTSFTQNFTSTWNEEVVYGRMDPIATFQNTRRSISLAFDIPASSLKVAQENLVECDRLAQFLYPTYTEQNAIGENKTIGKVISKPPLVSVKFANLVSAGGVNTTSKEGSGGLLGYLSGLDWSPDLAMGMFADGANNLFPKVISLSFTLNVLHQNVKGFVNGKWASNSFFGGHK